MMRRVRSSRCGHTARNFRFSSAPVFMLAKHNTRTHELDTFIYLHCLTDQKKKHEARQTTGRGVAQQREVRRGRRGDRGEKLWCQALELGFPPFVGLPVERKDLLEDCLGGPRD